MLSAHNIWGKGFSTSSYNTLTLGLKLKSCLLSLLQVLYVTLSFIRLLVCLTRGPQPLPKPVLQTVHSSVSSFNLQYHLITLRSFNNCLHLLSCLTVTSILPSTFPLITGFRMQLLCKMLPSQLAFLLFDVCRIFLFSLTLGNISSFVTWLVQLISIPLYHHISEITRYSWTTLLIVQVPLQYKAMLQIQLFTSSFLKFKSNFQMKKSLPSCWMPFYHGSPGFKCTCTSCIIWYFATQIVEIFHILQLFLIYHNL